MVTVGGRDWADSTYLLAHKHWENSTDIPAKMITAPCIPFTRRLGMKVFRAAMLGCLLLAGASGLSGCATTRHGDAVCAGDVPSQTAPPRNARKNHAAKNRVFPGLDV